MFYSIAETHFVYSSRSRQLMLDSGLGHKSIHVINNCLDHDTHVALRATVSSGKSPYPKSAGHVLVFVGRLTPQKKLHLLLRAQALRISEALATSVYVIGDGSERDPLEALAKSLGIEQFVHFLGATFDELTLAQHLYHADACVSPGEVGLTAIHALSFGTPVISHDDPDHQGPEYESIVDGATGGFFTRGSVSDLAACIERVAHTPGGRSAVRHRCMNLIDKSYTPEYQLYVFERGIRETYESA
jgi:glycosyltransferase involved in cell wall biosynthesis